MALIKPSAELLGYVLRERIGSGGYGEVWSATAPGGLSKAIKLIYGFHDENRAQRELKSLNRIKEVRHPFLLSLERIDVVDGQLVVVMELADGCLKTRFREARKEGLAGIPREELLNYIKDAADALDFLANEHSLQHLDVKPENLLIVGGHVKVADFGLVKDIHDGTQSLMGGLTPAYAPPELFDGQPSTNSDQYSLAIVYQEMVSGSRPFPGTTAAELASQHLSTRPSLSELSRGDQAVLQRALAKDPNARFPDCRTLAAELIGRRSDGKKKRNQRARTFEVPDALPTSVHDATAIVSEGLLPSEIRKLDPPELSGPEAVEPSLFIGIGQSGTTIVRHLKKRLRARQGADETLPAFGFVCIDTDLRDVTAATSGDGDDVLSNQEVIAMPLRKPAEYRSDPRLQFPWLSRRWIYNIPRSQQTEGLRPLGRLAFADHQDAFFRRVHSAIEDISKEEAVATTADTVELEPGEAVKVYIVASIAGGVGSGCVLDVGYAIRTALADKGIEKAEIVGVLLHSTGRVGDDRVLTTANSYACLGELQHYEAHGYPGDETLDIPEYDVGPFDYNYLVNLGDDLLQDEFDRYVNDISEYLYLSSTTRCHRYFNKCRHDETLNEESMVVRTFGLSASCSENGEAAHRPAREVCRRAVLEWVEPNDKLQIPVMAGKIATDVGLSLDALAGTVHQFIIKKLGKNPLDTLVKTVRSEIDFTAMDTVGPQRVAAWEQFNDAIDAAFGMVQSYERKNSEVTLGELIEEGISLRSQQMAEAIEPHIDAILDTPEGRLHCALGVVQQLIEDLKGVSDKLKEVRKQLDQEKEKTKAYLGSTPKKGETLLPAGEILALTARLRLKELVFEKSRSLAIELIQKIEPRRSRLAESTATLRDLADSFDAAAMPTARELLDGGKTANNNMADVVARGVTHMMDEVVDRVQKQLHQFEFGSAGGFSRFIVEGAFMRRLPMSLLTSARHAVTEVLKSIDLDKLMLEAGVSERDVVDWMRRHLNSAQPKLLLSGGATRILIATPARSNSKAINECFRELGENPTIVASTCGDIVVCYEVEQVPLSNVAVNLIQGSVKSADYVARIRTRTDVDFTPLTNLG